MGEEIVSLEILLDRPQGVKLYRRKGLERLNFGCKLYDQNK